MGTGLQRLSAQRPGAKGLGLLAVLALVVAGCTSAPPGVTPVQNFDLEAYLGTWYEIARLDHSFERGLSDVRADYALRPDGVIAVRNSGYGAEGWEVAEGRALPMGDPTVGHLKVSFFGPFYGAYVIFALDQDAGWALVSGPNRDFLWLLARSPELPPGERREALALAEAAGFEVAALIFPRHDRSRERAP
jgi:apolipoprotein D and lipocalin family protein